MLLTSHDLPSGYTFETTPHLTEEQAAVVYHPEFQHWSELRYQVNRYKSIDEKYRFNGFQSTYVGVLATGDSVVGVGCLRYDNKEAELSCLAVMPEHRGLKIGRWIIDERIRRAEEQGVQSLYIEGLASTNKLATYYDEKGFVKSTDSMSVRIFQVNQKARYRPHLALNLNK